MYNENMLFIYSMVINAGEIEKKEQKNNLNLKNRTEQIGMKL